MHMAKGQKKSNKEVRKPKAAKVKTEVVQSGDLTRGLLATAGKNIKKA